MNCHIIFYMAKKTSLCEKSLKKALQSVKLTTAKAFFAINPAQLGENLIMSLAESNIVITVGGLFSSDSMGIENVLSSALSHCPADEAKKLRNNLSGYDGYVIRKDCQLIIVLPDEPDEITEIFEGPLREYLADFCKN